MTCAAGASLTNEIGPGEETPLDTRRMQVYELTNFSHPSSQIRQLQLMQGVGEIPLTVYAAEFIADQGDKTAYQWKTGSGSHEMEMPRYCLTNLETVKTNVSAYIQESRSHYLRQLKDMNDVTWDHIRMAIRYADVRPVGLATAV